MASFSSHSSQGVQHKQEVINDANTSNDTTQLDLTSEVIAEIKNNGITDLANNSSTASDQVPNKSWVVPYHGMRDLANALSLYTNPRETLFESLKILAQLFEAEAVTLFNYDSKTETLVPLRPSYYDTSNPNTDNLTELESMSINTNEASITARAFRSGQPIFVNGPDPAYSDSTNRFSRFNIHNALALPLRIEQRIQGVCCLFNKKEADFDQQDVGNLEILAGLLATLLKNISLSNVLEHEERRHIAVLDVAVDGFIEVNRDMKITLFSKGAENLTGWNSEEVIGRHCHEVLMPHSPQNESLCNTCPLRRSFRYGTSTTNVETLIRSRDGDDNWVSCSYNSVTDERGKVVSGIIAIKDIYHLKALSDELRQQSQQQESLLGVNNAINGLSNIEEIYRVSLDAISRSINFDIGTIHSLNPDTQELTLMSLLEKEPEKKALAVSVVHYEEGHKGTGIALEDEELERQTRLSQYRATQTSIFKTSSRKSTDPTLPRHYAHECEALRQNEPYMAVNLPGKAVCAAISEFSGMQSHLCVPIKTGERNYGVLHLASSKPYAFWGSDFVLALSICKQIGVGAERARLFEQVDRLARTDPLTGLYNKRELWECLDRELRRAERRQSPLSLILIDLDRLKWINDCFGHT